MTELRIEITTNDQGNRTTPSYVAFTDSERLIGDAAKNQDAMNPTNTDFDAKRLIGRRFSDPSIQADMRHYPYRPYLTSLSPFVSAMTSSSAPSRRALSKIVCNRLQKELSEWQLNPPTRFRHKVTENLQKDGQLMLPELIDVTGAPGTLYGNETYQLQVEFPEHYPMEAPQLVFIPLAPSHPLIWGFLVSDASVIRDTHFGIWGKPVYSGIETAGVAAILGSSFYVSVVKTNAQPGIFVPVCLPRKAMRWFVEELHGEVPYVFSAQLVSNKDLNKLITSSVFLFDIIFEQD